MEVRWQRAFLLVLALGLILLAGWADLSTDAARLEQGTTPTATVTATATITPTKPPVRNEIVSPQPGDVLFGTAVISGTALIQDYQQYQLHIAESGSEDWHWLTTSFDVVRESVLYRLDTTRFPDGFYDLRVRAIGRDGNYTEAFVRRVEIRNENPPTPTSLPVNPNSPLATPSPLETPTPTPTIDTTSFVPGGQGLYEPRNGEVLSGYAKIQGTANAPDIYHRFDRYELYLASAGSENWSWLMSSRKQIYQDTLYVLDTTELENGYYDLRMRIVYEDSNYDEYFVRNLQVSNDTAIVKGTTERVVITSPHSDSVVVAGRAVDIVGTVVDPNFQRWELYWAPSERAGEESAWKFLFSGDYQVVDELIARVDLGQVPVGSYDFRLRVVRRDGNYSDYFIRRLHVALPTPTPQYFWYG